MLFVIALVYQTCGIVGSSDSPHIFEFAPIVPHFPSLPIQGGYFTSRINILNPSFVGTVIFKVFAKDAFYPEYLKAETNAVFCVVLDQTELLIQYEDADGDGFGNPNVYIYACQISPGFVSNSDDCDDTHAMDPLIFFDIIENSGSTPNDGNICPGAQVNVTALGGYSYIWSTGANSVSISISPASTSIYKVTTTHFTGCLGSKSLQINVEGTIVKNSNNAGEFKCI